MIIQSGSTRREKKELYIHQYLKRMRLSSLPPPGNDTNVIYTPGSACTTRCDFSEWGFVPRGVLCWSDEVPLDSTSLECPVGVGLFLSDVFGVIEVFLEADCEASPSGNLRAMSFNYKTNQLQHQMLRNSTRNATRKTSPCNSPLIQQKLKWEKIKNVVEKFCNLCNQKKCKDFLQPFRYLCHKIFLFFRKRMGLLNLRMIVLLAVNKSSFLLFPWFHHKQYRAKLPLPFWTTNITRYVKLHHASTTTWDVLVPAVLKEKASACAWAVIHIYWC